MPLPGSRPEPPPSSRCWCCWQRRNTRSTPQHKATGKRVLPGLLSVATSCRVLCFSMKDVSQGRLLLLRPAEGLGPAVARIPSRSGCSCEGAAGSGNPSQEQPRVAPLGPAGLGAGTGRRAGTSTALQHPSSIPSLGPDFGALLAAPHSATFRSFLHWRHGKKQEGGRSLKARRRQGPARERAALQTLGASGASPRAGPSWRLGPRSRVVPLLPHPDRRSQ